MATDNEPFESKEVAAGEAVVITKTSSGGAPVIESKPDDGLEQLQKQIEDLKKAEAAQRERATKAESERTEALNLAQERNVELSRHAVNTSQSRFDAVNSAIAAASAGAEKAQLDIENAINNGDGAAQAEAYRRLSRAETELSRLEDGKIALENDIRQEQARAAAIAKQAAQAPKDPLENSGLPDNAKNWLRSNPEYLTDIRKNAKLQALHYDVIDEGHRPFSPEYFESVEQHLGMRQAPEQDDPPQQQQRKSIVSAPVSREVPTGSTNRRAVNATQLTRDEREAAKLAGITDVEYAKQKQVLNELKAQGHYQGGN